MNRVQPGKRPQGRDAGAVTDVSGSKVVGRSIAAWHYYSYPFYHLDKSAVKKGGDR